MRAIPRNSIASSSVVVALILVFTPGCHNGMFSKPDFSNWRRPDLSRLRPELPELRRPDVSRLAFWKKERDLVPPPPAHHFDPAPASGEITADSTTARDRELDELVKSARERLTSNTSGESTPDIDPIREPYEVATTPKSSTATETPVAPENTFDLNLNTLANNSSASSPSTSNKGPGSATAGSEAPLTQAQMDFQAAIASANESISNSIASSQNSGKEFEQRVKDEFEKTRNSVDSLVGNSGGFNANDHKVNHSLYDSSGQLTTGLNGRSPKTTPPGSAFPGSSNVVNNDFARPATPTSKSGISTLQQSEAQFSLAQQQIEELKRQIEEVKAQAELAKQQPNPNLPSAEVSRPIDHVAKLNLNPSPSAGSFGAPPNTPAGNFSPMDSANGLGSVQPGSLSPSNQLRGASLPATQSQPLQPHSPPSNSYPSTAHPGFSGSFSANTQSSADVQSANLLTPNLERGGSVESGSVVQAGAPGPRIQAAPSSIAPASHVSDVDIPDAVLKGSGSFAPGTVNRLRPQK